MQKIAQGAKWSADRIWDLDFWGPETTTEDALHLGNMVVSRFEELASDYNAVWFPRTSEVWGDSKPLDPEPYEAEGYESHTEHLEALLEQAIEEVWEIELIQPTEDTTRENDDAYKK